MQHARFDTSPLPHTQKSDCWAVAFGDSHNDEERCVLAGYDNGDVKLFDLRANAVREFWRGREGSGADDD